MVVMVRIGLQISREALVIYLCIDVQAFERLTPAFEVEHAIHFHDTAFQCELAGRRVQGRNTHTTPEVVVGSDAIGIHTDVEAVED